MNLKLLFFIFLLSFSGYASAQSIDAAKKTKWINYDRKRGMDDGLISSDGKDVKSFVTSTGDIITRVLYKNRIGNDVLCEASYINNVKNGLEIIYHANGMVCEINYYLDGKIWETISSADSSGRLLNPGTLSNGSGTKIEYAALSKNIFSTTYKNGLPEGEYYKKDLEGVLKGKLTYKRSAINYNPAMKCTYITTQGDTATDIFDLDYYNTIFPDSNSKRNILLKAETDSLPQYSQEFSYIGILFNDPAIIPTGTWNRFRTDSSISEKIDHDENGNAIRVTYFDQKGKITRNLNFPPCNKRKLVMRNADGSYRDEVCK